MKRLINIWICLCVAASALAVTYQPCQSSSFRSTSVYVGGGVGYHQSPMTNHQSSFTNHRPSGSMQTISASNFARLNSEGGECYQPSYGARRPGLRREGRDDEDEDDSNNAIGEYDFHSPIGDGTWPLLLLSMLYVLVRKLRLERLVRPLRLRSKASSQIRKS